MKIFPLITLVIGVIVGGACITDLTGDGSKIIGMLALVVIAISGGSLAICMQVEDAAAKIKPTPPPIPPTKEPHNDPAHPRLRSPSVSPAVSRAGL